MDPIAKFQQEVCENIKALGEDRSLWMSSLDWIVQANSHRYTYNFSWLGRPVIQFPQDIVGMQELIWKIKPDLIVETGIAHGGSLIFSASMLAMLDYCEAVTEGRVVDPKTSKRRVVGVDIDIRAHNRAAIEAHPMARLITMIQGSSIAPETVEQVRKISSNYQRILVVLDSNHTHEHVLAELEAYAPLTSVGSYCCVFDSLIEDMPSEMFRDRPWGKGDNPKTAVWEYLKNHPEFEIDKSIQDKLMITVAPDGFLKRVV